MKLQGLSKCFLLIGLATTQILFALEGIALPQAVSSESQAESLESIATQIKQQQEKIDLLRQSLSQATPKELMMESPATTGNPTTRDLQQEILRLEKQVDIQNSILDAQSAIQQLRQEYNTELAEFTAKTPTTGAPANPVPALNPNLAYSDITCRPKLDISEPDKGGTVVEQNGKLVLVPSSPGSVVPPPDKFRKDCVPLAPLTRLILENSDFVASGSYSNSAGVSNALLPGNQLITTATTSYFVGVGYAKKPILKQLRALFYPADSRDAISKQGTFMEDFFWNAVTFDGSYSWGRQLLVKGGTPVVSYNSRPFYSAALTYTADLEKLYIDLKNGSFHPQTVRPADQGWYFGPKDSDYYQSTNESFGWPRPEDY